jgi:hypothetical protein
MSYKLSLSYAILDDSTSAVTVLFHLEFWWLDIVRWFARGRRGWSLWPLSRYSSLEDEGDKPIFKLAVCIPNVKRVPCRMNWDLSLTFYFHAWEPVCHTFVSKFSGLRLRPKWAQTVRALNIYQILCSTHISSILRPVGYSNIAA